MPVAAEVMSDSRIPGCATSSWPVNCLADLVVADRVDNPFHRIASRIAGIDQLRYETTAWQEDVNQTQRGVERQLKIDDARNKLISVYPKIKMEQSTSFVWHVIGLSLVRDLRTTRILQAHWVCARRHP